jgi:Flp pilus assembly protein TadD
MADYALWGDRPFGYHLTNILLHTLVSVLVYLVLARIFPGKNGVAFASALVFAVHPVHAESVAWIAGRTDLIATLFMVASLLALSSAPGRRGCLALSLLSFLVALFSKESALVFPLIAAAYLAAFCPGWARPLRLRLILLYTVCVAAYLAVRFGPAEVKAGPAGVLMLWETVFSSCATLFLYVGKLALPVRLSAYITNPVAGSPLDLRAAAGAAILLAMLATMALAWRRGDRASAFILAFALVSLAPLANVVRISAPDDMGFPAAERFLYAPSIPLIAAAVSLISLAVRGARERAGLAAVIVAIFAAMTLRRNAVWKDEESLFTDALRSSPRAPLLWNNLGVWYSRSGRHDDAVRCIERAIALGGPTQRLLTNLAAAMRGAGRYDESLSLLDDALAGEREYAAIYHNYGKTYAAMGDDESAAAAFEKALGLRPRQVEILVDLAESCKRTGRYDLAERRYREALALHPSSAALWSNLGVVRKLSGDLEGARAAFEKSLSLDPNASVARGNLGVVLAKLGMYQEALAELSAARSLESGNLDAANALGVLLARVGKEGPAEDLFLEIALSHPADKEAIINMGILKHRQGKMEEAARWFERARTIAPDDPRVALFFKNKGSDGASAPGVLR